MQHRTYTARNPRRKFVAACDCGWRQDFSCSTKPAAETLAREHAKSQVSPIDSSE